MDDVHESPEPTSGAMVIRAWSAAGSAQGFHARLTIMTAGGDQESVDLAESEQVLESVRQWLSTFAPEPPRGPIDPEG